jgi:hypothetical protein
VQRSQAFSTSQRFTPPCTLMALFHATYTLGVFPSEVSPRWNPLRLPTPAPLLTLPPGSVLAFHGKPLSTIPFPFGSLQGFIPPASPFSNGRCYPPARADPLLGLVPSKGLPGCSMNTLSRTLLSRTFTPVRLTRRFDSPLPGAPEFYSYNLWLVCPRSRRNPSRLPSFLGFIPFSLLTIF